MEPLLNMDKVSYSRPQLEVNDEDLGTKSIFDYGMDDFHLLNYKPGPIVKLEMAV